MLARNETEPSCQVTALVKSRAISDGRGERCRCERPDSGDSEETSAVLFSLCLLGEFSVYFLDLLLQLPPFVSNLYQECSHAQRQQVVSVFQN